MRYLVSCCFLFAHIVAAAPPPVDAAQSRSALEPFIQQNCVACHGPANKLGGLDLQALPLDPDDSAALARWVRVRDRVEHGEMPPKGAPRPPEASSSEFVGRLDAALTAFAHERRRGAGRVAARRLTRFEYENTLHDLLAIADPVQQYLPQDGIGEAFDTVANGQQMSHFLLERYLQAADAALDAAFRKAIEGPEPVRRDFDMSQLVAKKLARQPEGYADHVVSWSSAQVFYGRMGKTTVDESGWYRIGVTAAAINPPENGRLWTMLRHGVAFARAPQMFYVGAMELTPEPRDFVFDAWIEKGHMLELRPWDATLRRVGGNVIAALKPGEAEADGLPGAKVTALSMERIYPGGSAERTRQVVFGELGPEPADEEKALESQLLAFARRAFRRPVEAGEIAGYVELAKQELVHGYAAALRGGYRALLCSPRFLFFVEQPGPLDGYSIAARLSYLLWSTAPDAELLAAAKDGALETTAGRRAQLDRMLADSRSDRFVATFLDQWLELDEIDFTQPDQTLYPEFDDILKASMVEESRRFFRTLLDEDLSVSNIVDSDFTFLNSRLAKHYDLPDPEGLGFQRVLISPDSPRGGLMTQASVLKVTANGTTTSPVVRGAFVTERILGKEVPPPPPDVPAVEPDIRGAKTIREQLALHRDNPACAACHLQMDPPGFALESFDPVGGYREAYRVLPPEDPDGKRAKKWTAGPAVDPSYALPSGESFRNIEEFKGLVAADRPQLARNLAEQLLAYGGGARVEYADRGAVDQIVAAAAENDYGVRSLLYAVVESPLFLSK